MGRATSGSEAAPVKQASYAAYSDTTSNPGNDFTAGAVSISDNKSGVALSSVGMLATERTAASAGS